MSKTVPPQSKDKKEATLRGHLLPTLLWMNDHIDVPAGDPEAMPAITPCPKTRINRPNGKKIIIAKDGRKSGNWRYTMS